MRMQEMPAPTGEMKNPNEDWLEQADIVKKYKPTYIAEGAEYIVYEVDGHPDVVVKLAKDPLKFLLDYNREHGIPADKITPEGKGFLEDLFLKHAKDRFYDLRKHFGSEHTPPQRHAIVKVPLTLEYIKKVFNGRVPKDLAREKQAHCLVTVQRKVHAMALRGKDSNVLSVSAGYSETSHPDPGLYKSVAEKLLMHPEKRAVVSKEDLAKLQPGRGLKQFLERMDEEPELKEALKDLIQKTISFANEKGEVFDFAGRDNIIFTKKNGKWNYELVDPFVLTESGILTIAKNILTNVASGHIPDRVERVILLNAINFARVVNGLAGIAGVDDRVKIIPDEFKEGDMDLLSSILRGQGVNREEETVIQGA